MCLQWLRGKLQSIFRPKGTTPLPGAVMMALFFSMFSNAVSMQMLFAFLPDMVKSFGIADEDAGYYVGMISSAVFFGRFLSSYFWGWISDKVGRRLVLLYTTFLLAVTTVAFGFSKSFIVALVIRFFTGLVAGIAGTVKACLTDICDDSNQPLGMSLVATAWNSGLLIGPALGGYLSKPASKYSVFKESSFFKNFAYLLPCLVNAALTILSFLLVFFILPETLVTKRQAKEREMQSVFCEEAANTLVGSSPSSRKRSTVKSGQENVPNGGHSQQQHAEEAHKPFSDVNLFSGSVSFLPDIHVQSYPYESDTLDSRDRAKVESYQLPDGKPKPGFTRRLSKALTHSKLMKLCRNKDVRYSVSVYTVFSFAVVAEHEMYSVWAATGRGLGGLDFDTNDLGFTLMVVGFGCAVSNFILFPQSVRVFGLMKTQFITLITSMFFTMILPSTNILYGRGSVLKITVIFVLLMIRVTQGLCFTGQFIFLSNSVPSNLRATIHGFAMTMVCLARTISPTVMGSIYSWSITSGLGFPFNENCVFICMGIVYWIALLIACCMDEKAVTERTIT